MPKEQQLSEETEEIPPKPILKKIIDIPIKLIQIQKEPILVEIIGPTACGKSHLLRAFLLDPEFYLGFTPTSIFFVYKFWQNDYMSALQNKYKNKINFITDFLGPEQFNTAPFKQRNAQSELGILSSTIA